MGNSLERQKIKEAGVIITSFAASYEEMKKTKFSCEFKKLIKKPNFLHSLSALSLYKVGTHLKEEEERQRNDLRHQSRYCLFQIQRDGDEQDFADLVNVGIGKVLTIAFCTAGGAGEEEDWEIFNVLNHFYYFLRELYEGRHYQQLSLKPLQLLARRTEEQIEEEGANDELEAQIKNNENNSYISVWANKAKAVILNCFIRRR
ncbi:MAG: hypothetical protein EZS28_028570 [Streblomastix strix]|uniref:Uncharacterized protein n=1 Tax=Streblomastix strix TaxID=222440 RepID=A0A5J4V051_9EUKA|nr:MAG: hypothetical protein EZS28_028570 [Streblomastix strix]